MVYDEEIMRRVLETASQWVEDLDMHPDQVFELQMVRIHEIARTLHLVVIEYIPPERFEGLYRH